MTAFAIGALSLGIAIPMHAGEQFLWTAPKAAVQNANEATVRTIINEDFSGLTDGTESTPSTESLINPNTGYIVDRTKFKPYTVGTENDHTWGGYNLYSAGGSLAVMNGGFLNTPSGNMSGKIKISFRIKLLNNITNPSIDVILLSRKQLVDYERWTINLTNEWQQVTLTSNNGWFENTGIQFFNTNFSLSFLIDDIKVVQEISSIIPPEIEEPENTTDNSFTAVWYPTNEAKEYLLSVYSKTENPDIVKASENFNSLNANADGSLTLDTPLPEGWGAYWENDVNQISSNGGINGSSAIQLNKYGDYVQTPIYKHAFSNYTINVKITSDKVLKGTALLYVYENGNWFPWQYIGMEALRQLNEWTEIKYLASDFAAFDNPSGVRIVYQPAEGDDASLLVDNISYTVPGDPILNYVLQDKVIKGQASDRYEVTGLDEAIDYFYSVKARNTQYTSAASKEMEVFHVSTPTALPATNVDVANNSYTANWVAGSKVDYFRVDQIRETVLQQDDPEYEILYEGFDKVVSEITENDIEYEAESGEPTSSYLPIDDLTKLSGWKASSYQYINGWLGGNVKAGDEYIAGAIVTPVLDLSHNDGMCNVSVRAFGYGGDILVIQGVKASTYNAIRFPDEGGIVEATVTLPLCEEREYLTFYSNNYYPFLIDFIRITQSMKAGETASIITKTIVTDDASVRSADITNAGFDNSSTLKYKVTGFRYFHGNTKDIWASKPSDLVTIQGETGIENVNANNVSAINAMAEGVEITVNAESTINVYRADGTLAKQAIATPGTTQLSLDAGLYIVNVGSQSIKVSVR